MLTYQMLHHHHHSGEVRIMGGLDDGQMKIRVGLVGRYPHPHPVLDPIHRMKDLKHLTPISPRGS